MLPLVQILELAVNGELCEVKFMNFTPKYAHINQTMKFMNVAILI